MKQMHASVCIDLPADEFEEAAAKLKMKPIWEAFGEALAETGLVYLVKLETLETRAKPVPTNGRKRLQPGRKRLPPELVPPPSGEAA